MDLYFNIGDEYERGIGYLELSRSVPLAFKDVCFVLSVFFEFLGSVERGIEGVGIGNVSVEGHVQGAGVGGSCGDGDRYLAWCVWCGIGIVLGGDGVVVEPYDDVVLIFSEESLFDERRRSRPDIVSGDGEKIAFVSVGELLLEDETGERVIELRVVACRHAACGRELREQLEVGRGLIGVVGCIGLVGFEQVDRSGEVDDIGMSRGGDGGRRVSC